MVMAPRIAHSLARCARRCLTHKTAVLSVALPQSRKSGTGERGRLGRHGGVGLSMSLPGRMADDRVKQKLEVARRQKEGSKSGI